MNMADVNEHSDPELLEFKRKMLSGALSAECPFPGMDDPWTEEAKERLKVALAKVFGWDEAK